MNYVLGIDGGGTKATAVVMDEQGGVCEWFSGEAVNVNSESRAAVEERLSRISTQVQQRFPNDTCVAVCAGVAALYGEIIPTSIRSSKKRSRPILVI